MRSLDNRVPPPLVVLVTATLMWMASRRTPHWGVPDAARLSLSALILAAGFLIGAAGLKAFRQARTTIDPVHLDAASTLVTTGIFRHSRNPMYVGFALLLSAWAIYLAAPWTLIGTVMFVVFTWRFQILPEERVMQTKFGEAYADYRRQVRRWL